MLWFYFRPESSLSCCSFCTAWCSVVSGHCWRQRWTRPASQIPLTITLFVLFIFTPHPYSLGMTTIYLWAVQNLLVHVTAIPAYSSFVSVCTTISWWTSTPRFSGWVSRTQSLFQAPLSIRSTSLHTFPHYLWTKEQKVARSVNMFLLTYIVHDIINSRRQHVHEQVICISI